MVFPPICPPEQGVFLAKRATSKGDAGRGIGRTVEPCAGACERGGARGDTVGHGRRVGAGDGRCVEGAGLVQGVGLMVNG